MKFSNSSTGIDVTVAASVRSLEATAARLEVAVADVANWRAKSFDTAAVDATPAGSTRETLRRMVATDT